MTRPQNSNFEIKSYGYVTGKSVQCVLYRVPVGGWLEWMQWPRLQVWSARWLERQWPPETGRYKPKALRRWEQPFSEDWRWDYLRQLVGTSWLNCIGDGVQKHFPPQRTQRGPSWLLRPVLRSTSEPGVPVYKEGGWSKPRSIERLERLTAEHHSTWESASLSAVSLSLEALRGNPPKARASLAAQGLWGFRIETANWLRTDDCNKALSWD